MDIILRELSLLPDDIKNIIIDYSPKPVTIGIILYCNEKTYTMFIDILKNNLYKCGIISNLSISKFMFNNLCFNKNELIKFYIENITTYNINIVDMYFLNTRKYGYKKIDKNDTEYMNKLITNFNGNCRSTKLYENFETETQEMLNRYLNNQVKLYT